jgi:hypothetical protein
VGRGAAVAAVVVACALAIAGCGSSSSSTATTTTTGVPVIHGTTTTAPSVTVNLTVTPSLRATLLAAAAKEIGLPVSDFTGLTAGKTYYAYDPATKTYWAGAQLVASPASQQAQVSTQDDGSYYLFVQPVTHNTWAVYADGLGTVPGAHCAIVTPPSIRTVWGWSLSTPCGGPA